MKTFRIILSIAGVALTSITFGQLLSQNDEGFLLNKYTYNYMNEGLEHHLYENPYKSVHGDRFESSMAARTYFAPMETEPALEEWMTSPFESNYYEVEPFIESWMTTPFESNYYEVEPFIESWMTRPFDLDDDIEIEAWMTTSWS